MEVGWVGGGVSQITQIFELRPRWEGEGGGKEIEDFIQRDSHTPETSEGSAGLPIGLFTRPPILLIYYIGI